MRLSRLAAPRRRLSSAIIVLGALTLTVPAAAQRADANAALMRCAKASGVPFPYATAAPTGSDAASLAAASEVYERRRRAHDDSMRVLAQTCLATITPASVADTLLDSLASVQFRAGKPDDAAVSLLRMLRAPLPLEERVTRVNWTGMSLPLSPAALTLRRAMLPVTDSLHKPERSMSARFDLGRVTRAIDSLAVYNVVYEVADYLATLDSAERATAAHGVNNVMNNFSFWVVQDQLAAEALGLVARIATLYPGKSEFLDVMNVPARRAASLGQTGIPFRSKYWLNVDSATMPHELPRGRVRLVEFTTSWCSACKTTYRPLEATYKALRARGLDVVFVVPSQFGGFPSRPGNPVNETTMQRYRDLFKPYDLTLPIMVAEDLTYDHWYGVNGLPQFAVLDRDGVVRDAWTGADGLAERIERSVMPLLKGE